VICNSLVANAAAPDGLRPGEDGAMCGIQARAAFANMDTIAAANYIDG